MKDRPIAKDSPFIASLVNATPSLRQQIEIGMRERNGSDDLHDNAEQLCDLVNQLFWTSLHVEEGRPVRGTLCICSPDPEQTPCSRAFDEPVPLSVKSLISLFTASPRAPLAVHANGDRIEVWGMLDYTPMFVLRLRIASTGVVVASENQDVIAVLEREEVHIPKSAGEFDLTMIVARALDGNRAFSDRREPIFLAALLQRVVIAMYRLGHGGTLVVLPSKNNESWSEDVLFKYRFDSAGTRAVRELWARFREAQERHQEILRRPPSQDMEPSMVHTIELYKESVIGYREQLNSLLRAVGELSAVDGAVVMDEELNLLGFGAKLVSEAKNINVLDFDALSGQTKTTALEELGGTRHQSAARFVSKNREAMVFVASQDGRLTLLSWVVDPGKVVALRRLEHFVWEFQP
ncbi:MAG: hypothetical protein KME17_24860 [Cyanosarcina radialis HA8281-LM2]|jgi:hypothetical protein|nr:hypothetical protein [Cyanosarcina radialis HA8281-LM2]